MASVDMWHVHEAQETKPLHGPVGIERTPSSAHVQPGKRTCICRWSRSGRFPLGTVAETHGTVSWSGSSSGRFHRLPVRPLLRSCRCNKPPGRRNRTSCCSRSGRSDAEDKRFGTNVHGDELTLPTTHRPRETLNSSWPALSRGSLTPRPLSVRSLAESTGSRLLLVNGGFASRWRRHSWRETEKQRKQTQNLPEIMKH